MGEDAVGVLEVSRRIEASASVIFELLADPSMHLAIDGSDMLRGSATDDVVSGVGDVFVMNMYFEGLGEYQMDNYIVEFEQDRRLAWEPQAGAGHPGAGYRMGHRWGFTLVPDGPHATVVTETYDCSSSPAEFREGMQNGRIWAEGMARTLERIEQMAIGGRHP